MSEEVKVLAQLLKNGSFDNEDAKVGGIAQLALDKGYDHLTEPQKSVLKSYLTKHCEGVTNPGGHHNECLVVLDGAELATAIENEGYYGAILCENCINETEQYSREWDRIKAE
ncbi:hypothetical protein HFV06_08780 [Pseudomonas fluorescens]|nr:hypothetical protein [Pseudomonas fluorescens]NKI51434.1 hypothetical protein [Pseudomonas fluorescens]NKI63927.1 hypothetical protein [Pseudomonas fluorescens]